MAPHPGLEFLPLVRVVSLPLDVVIVSIVGENVSPLDLLGILDHVGVVVGPTRHPEGHPLFSQGLQGTHVVHLGGLVVVVLLAGVGVETPFG